MRHHSVVFQGTLRVSRDDYSLNDVVALFPPVLLAYGVVEAEPLDMGFLWTEETYAQKTHRKLRPSSYPQRDSLGILALSLSTDYGLQDQSLNGYYRALGP